MLTVEILENNQRRLRATFLVPGPGADLNDTSTWTPTDPSTIEFTRKRLGASDSTIESWLYSDALITRDGAGLYSKILDFLTAGTWRLGARGTGACTAYEEITVVVKNAEARA